MSDQPRQQLLAIAGAASTLRRTQTARATHSLAAPSLGMLLFGLAGLSGCTVGPDYTKPDVAAPEQWIGTREATSPSRLTPEQRSLADWWRGLQDPTLDGLVERALTGNLSLVEAAARVRQARAARTVTAAAGLPTLSVDGSASRSRSPSSGGSTTGNLFRAGFDAGWEIDVFGGIRRSVEAADADTQSFIENARDIRVTLLAELASNYIDLRAAQEQLEIAQRNLTAQRQTLEITRRRQGAGFVSKLDVANAEAQVASTEARIPSLEVTVRQSSYALATLLGLQPGALVEELATPLPLAALPPTIPAGLPSDLLTRRPDIRRSESELHAATARIGVATADLYPKFSLSGAFGFEGGRVSALGSLAQRYWSIGPAVQWQIFSGGAINANIEQQQAAADGALARYKGTILLALQEVESSMVALDREQRRTVSLDQSVKSSQDAVRYSLELYQAGRTDFLNVLNAQRSLLDAESTRLESRRLSLTNLIGVYKALGGGWSTEPPVDTSSLPSTQP